METAAGRVGQQAQSCGDISEIPAQTQSPLGPPGEQVLVLQGQPGHGRGGLYHPNLPSFLEKRQHMIPQAQPEDHHWLPLPDILGLGPFQPLPFGIIGGMQPLLRHLQEGSSLF